MFPLGLILILFYLVERNLSRDLIRHTSKDYLAQQFRFHVGW
jgi:hypothetical protein